MRVLLDTNVLAAGMVGALRSSTKPPARIGRFLLGKRFELPSSKHVLAELGRTFEHPWFVARVSPSEHDQQFAILSQISTVVDITDIVEGVASHPADDFVLATAVSGNANYLVTGDIEFRRVGEYRGVKVRTPVEFLIVLDTAFESE